MPGDVGPSEVLLLLLLAVVLFGPQRLAQIGRSLGKAAREFREGLSNAPDSLDSPPDAAPRNQRRPS